MKIHHLDRLERRIQYQFKDKMLLERALTHKSAGYQNNERLEFLGDAILNFVIADLLFAQFPFATEGELTRSRAGLVNKSMLSEIAVAFSLSDYLNLGAGEQKSGGFRRESILADTLEALVGAIYLDAGFVSCRDCLSRWFIEKIKTLKPKEQEKDPKTRLQEWLQADQKPLPKYEILSIEGEPHEQVFTVSCEVEGMGIVTGSGTSRRLAEQIAAKEMWERISHE